MREFTKNLTEIRQREQFEDRRGNLAVKNKKMTNNNRKPRVTRGQEFARHVPFSIQLFTIWCEM